MSSRKKSFIGGAAVLGVAGLICKIIGAAFRIPLANVLAKNGMAYYSMAYPLYSALLVISSSGIPTAISKMVSAKVSTGEYRKAHHIFQISFRVLTIIGIGTTVLMLVGARPISSLMGQPEGYPAIIAIAPSLMFVSILSAYRGYFQGLQMMTPTALSQLIEQVGKLVIGLMLARSWSAVSPQMGAAGALVGVTVSELVAMFSLIVLYNFKKGEIKHQIRTSPRVRAFDSSSTIVNQLMRVAVPVTLGACIMPIVSLIDSAMVVNVLQSIGYSKEIAQGKYGLLTGFVAPVINMPAVISTALQMSLVPAISSAMAAKQKRQLVKTSTMGVKMAILIGMPCAVGLFIMGGPVMMLLYKGKLAGQMEDLATVTSLMRVMSIGLLFLTVIQTVTGILQGIGKTMVPVRNLAIGAVVKVVSSYLLMRRPELNVLGAPVSTALCYFTAMVLNMYYVISYVGINFSLGDYIIRPGLATAGMGVVAYFSYMFMSTRTGNTVSCAVAILAAVFIYVVLVLLLGALKQEDSELLPGGRKLDNFMRRIGLWG